MFLPFIGRNALFGGAEEPATRSACSENIALIHYSSSNVSMCNHRLLGDTVKMNNTLKNRRLGGRDGTGKTISGILPILTHTNNENWFRINLRNFGGQFLSQHPA